MKKKRAVPHFISHEFGGPLLKASHAKSHRPISQSKPMHFVLRTNMAKGSASFLNPRNRRKILAIIRKHKGLVRLQNVVLETGQLQLYLKSKSRQATLNYIRTVSGLVARQMLGAEKNHPILRKKRFWCFRPYSRVHRPDPHPKAMALQKYLIGIHVLPATIVFNSS